MIRSSQIVLLALCACLGHSPISAQEIPVEQMTIDGLKQYVKDKDIRSVEELMQRLPGVVRQTFALIEDSRSRQRPSSALYPRILMYLPDGRFFITVATARRSRAYNDVEMLEFATDKNWRLDLIRFPPATHRRSRKADFDARRNLPPSESCTGCHGPSKRPIWGAYPIWPGVFADNAGQRLTDRQARRLTEALSSTGNPRVKLLDFRGKLTWVEGDPFSIPAYHDVPSPALPNDAILARHTEHLERRMECAPERKLLAVAYLFLDIPGFLESTGDEHLAAVLDTKRRLRQFIDTKFTAGDYDYAGSNYGDKVLLLFGFDTYDDLFVKRSLRDLNPSWESRETDIDRNFGAGGDDLDAFVHLLNTNYLITEYPSLADRFRATPFPYLSDYTNHDDYRRALSDWLWRTTVAQRVTHLQRKRHLAEQLRFSYLYSNELQRATVENLLRIADDLLTN